MTLDGLTALGLDDGRFAPFFLVSARSGHTIDPSELSKQLSAGDVSRVVVEGRQRPVEVRGYSQIRRMPLMLVIVLGLLLLVGLAHNLAAGARHRRRDLAVLRAMGFTGGQVQRAIVVQSIVVVAIVSAIALPIGLIAGAWAWQFTARWLGISDDTAFPVVHLVTLMAAVTASAVLIAAIAGRHASRYPLRTSVISE